jgi:hypothetical protein
MVWQSNLTGELSWERSLFDIFRTLATSQHEARDIQSSALVASISRKPIMFLRPPPENLTHESFHSLRRLRHFAGEHRIAKESRVTIVDCCCYLCAGLRHLALLRAPWIEPTFDLTLLELLPIPNQATDATVRHQYRTLKRHPPPTPLASTKVMVDAA